MLVTYQLDQEVKMSIFDDMDWSLGSGSTYGDKNKTAAVDPESLGGYKRWTNDDDKTATTKQSKSKEFLSRFKKDFKNKFRDNR